MAREENRDVRVEYRGTGFYVSLVVIFVAALTLLVLAVQNTGEVTVEILVFEFDLPLFAVILAAGLVAVILVELIGVVWRRQRRIQLSERAELQSLRAEREAREADPESEEPDEDLDNSDDPSVSSLTGNAGTGEAELDSGSREP